MTRKILALTLLSLLAAPALGQTLADTLAGIIETGPIADRTFVAVQVADAETGEILFERFPNHLMTPASNMKLYSSACALETWGPDHRFVTEVVLDGDLEDGVLDGDIILRGGGDPVLTSEDLQGIAQRVRDELGVESVTGGVVIDESLFRSARKGPGWMWDDDPDGYNMSIAAIMLDYNVLGAAATGEGIQLTPASDYPPTRVEGTGGLDRLPFVDVITAGEGASGTRAMTMHDPPRWIGGVFDRMLADVGIETAGRPLVEREASDLEADLTHESMPLSEILPLFNKPSENAIGEMLIHMLAVEAGHVPATWGDGAAVIADWLTGEAGLDAGDFRVVDGSGLSRYNLICASGTVQLLCHMWASENRDVFLASLPNMGVDGTVRSRLSSLPNRVLAKTGTMSGVSCLSGYVQTESGRWLAFSILTNGYIGSSVPSRTLQDQLCMAMAHSE